MTVISLNKTYIRESFIISISCRKLWRENRDHMGNPSTQEAQDGHLNKKLKDNEKKSKMQGIDAAHSGKIFKNILFKTVEKSSLIVMTQSLVESREKNSQQPNDLQQFKKSLNQRQPKINPRNTSNNFPPAGLTVCQGLCGTWKYLSPHLTRWKPSV